jgi:hypothetical protein
MRWTAIPIPSSAATAKSLAQIPRSCSAQPTLRVLKAMLAFQPDRANPGSLRGAANAAKKQA